jgi:TonB family protein
MRHHATRDRGGTALTSPRRHRHPKSRFRAGGSRVEDDFPTLEEIRDWFDRTGPVDGPIEVAPSEPTEASANPYVAFDELPVLLSIGAPVYPDLARAAGIEGTVLVRVLVTRTGKVQDAVAVEGPAPLHASAVDAARTALFKPALQGDNPVEVWVMIPITFSLSR